MVLPKKKRLGLFCGNSLPWAAPGQWSEANQSIAQLIERLGGRLSRAKGIAARIGWSLDALGPLMAELCALTCPRCLDSCCLRARVYFDLADLLFIHLAGQNPPPAQVRSSISEPCRYFSPAGCTLDRSTRPWVCTWYLCPEQKALLNRIMPERKAFCQGHAARIRALRRDLVDIFLKAAG